LRPLAWILLLPALVPPPLHAQTTAAVKQMAHARVCGIFRVGEIDVASVTGAMRPFSHRIPGTSMSGDASASAMAALSTSCQPP